MSTENQLKQIAINLVSKGKGILAADESNPTCKKRFDSIEVESSFKSRNEYRDMLFTSNKIEDFILNQNRFQGAKISPSLHSKCG